MKKYKVTYNYYNASQKKIGVRIVQAYDREHAIMKMAMWPKLILKVESYGN